MASVQKNKKNFVKNISIKYWAVAAGWFISLTLIGYSPLDSWLQEKFAWPVEFSVRQRIMLDPDVSPKLKILTFDDKALAALDRPYLRLAEWATILERVAAQSPRVILVDKIFGTVDGGSDAEPLRRLRAIGTPIVTGAFVAPQVIEGRKSLDLAALNENEVSKWLRLDPKSGLSATEQFRGILPRVDATKVYGSSTELDGVLKRPGHIHYEGRSTIRLGFLVNQRSTIKSFLPYFGLYAANNHYLREGAAFLDGKRQTVTSSGDVLVNFVDKSKLMRSTRSVLDLMRRDSETATDFIKRDDVVVILPLFYTGNTDFKDTALGQMPASFAHLSFVNSVLKGEFLNSVGYRWVFAGLASIVGVAIAAYIDGWLIVVALLFVGFVIFGASTVGLFALAGASVPWVYALLGVVGSGMSIYVMRTSAYARRLAKLRHGLEGAVDSRVIRRIAASGSGFDLHARECVVTIVFLDVVGYSLLAENQIPRVAFSQLKDLLSKISAKVHHHGGMVNKTLGDGLLCIFGYEFETGATSSDHAERAVACAIQIQSENLARNLKASEQNELVYPLRVGVHTAAVYLGDLGTGSRLDFTAVGNGVNHAKRLEQACDIHSVLMSATTKDLISGLGLSSDGLIKKKISIKHHSYQVEAFEFDPFYNRAQDRIKAIDAYRRCASLARLDQRYEPRHPENLVVRTALGQGRIINYSSTGMSMKMRASLAPGSVVQLKIDSSDHRLSADLEKLGIGELQCEVRWSEKETDGSVHGLAFIEMDEVKSTQLVEAIKATDLIFRYSQNSKIVA